jgi:hypothetical protein
MIGQARSGRGSIGVCERRGGEGCNVRADTKSVGARIDECLERKAHELVDAYFGPDGGFAGDLFDTLGENDPYRITEDDLLAVTLLGVRFGRSAMRYLLEEVPEQISSELRHIDPTARIWDDTEAILAGPATKLWHLVWRKDNADGIAATITGKLLARKRPHLIPIIDSKVELLLQLKATDADSWLSIRDAMTNADRRARLAALQPRGVRQVSVLRLLDVMLWMNGSQSESAKAARRKAGLET